MNSDDASEVRAVLERVRQYLDRYGWDVAPPVKPGPDGRYPTALQGKAEFENWRM